MLALFDETHGQNHWSQTGFSSRQMHTNFAGLAKQLAASGFACESHASGLLQAAVAQVYARAGILSAPRRRNGRCRGEVCRAIAPGDGHIESAFPGTLCRLNAASFPEEST